MAGGKETPRQRMIGMMYLVLTALLALQVSNQILQKFVLLNDGMERTSRNYSAKNISLVSAIENTAKQQGNREKDVRYIPLSIEVRKSTQELYNYIESLKNELIVLSNAKDEKGSFLTGSLKNTEATGNLFANQGKGEELKSKLNEYPKIIEKLLKQGDINQSFEPIAKDAAEIPLFANDMEARNKSFVTLNFVKSPVGAVLAILTQFQNAILNIESEALGLMVQQMGGTIYKADSTFAQISTQSKRVVAGTSLEGTMFLASSSSAISPIMTLNGNNIPVENGVGKIDWKVGNPTNYDDQGVSKNTLKGQIAINIGGEDKIMPIEYEYFVIKPTIKVSSKVVQQLYAECANDLQIEVPGLPSDGLSFDVTNGVKASAKGGNLIVVPGASGEVSIQVKHNNSPIGIEKFPIKPVPNPIIAVLKSDNSSELDLKKSFTAAELGNIKIIAKPETNFAQVLPKEAIYAIPNGTISLVRNEVQQGESIKIGSSIRGLLQNAKAGDYLLIEISSVARNSPLLNKQVVSSLKQVIALRVK
jgi:gliding motility-associated protein GldM